MPSTDLPSSSQHALFNVPEHDLTLTLEASQFRRPNNRHRSKSDPYMTSPIVFEPTPGIPEWAFGSHGRSNESSNLPTFGASPLPVGGIDPRALDGSSPSLTAASIPSYHAGPSQESVSNTGEVLNGDALFDAGRHSLAGPSAAGRRRSAAEKTPYEGYGDGPHGSSGSMASRNNQTYLIPPSPMRRSRSHGGHRRAARSEDFTASTSTPHSNSFEGIDNAVAAPLQYSGYQPSFPPMPVSQHQYNLPPLPTPLDNGSASNSASPYQHHHQHHHQQHYDQQQQYEPQSYNIHPGNYIIPPLVAPVTSGYSGYVSNAAFDGSYAPPHMIYAPLEEDNAIPFETLTMNRARRRSSVLSDVSGWSGTASDVTLESKTTEATKQAARRRRKDPNSAKFQCEYCGETFTRAYNLKGHIRSHEGSKPFDCKECGKGFARRHDLKRHENLHSGVKKFLCEACHTPFVRMDALQRHHKSEVSFPFRQM